MPIQTQFPTSLFGANTSEISSLLSIFTGDASGDAGFACDGSDTIFAAYRLSGDRYLAFSFPAGRLVADAAAPDIETITTKRLAVGTGIEGVTRSGTWSQFFPNIGYFGGGYRRTFETGAYAELTTPAGATRVGAFAVGSSNAGIHLVTINGDSTLANSLPTAQELVDGGTLDSAALVANGGTLNPPDRVWDNYASAGTAPYGWVEFADGLEPGAHTIRITNTGYKNTAAGDDGLYLAGIWHNVGSISTSSDALFLPDSRLSGDESRLESAIRFQPDLPGVTVDEWMGHTGTEFTTSVAFYVDGVEVTTPGEGEMVGGDSAQLVVNAYYRHPQTGETRVAKVVRTYTITARDGIRIQYELTWLVDGETLSAYTAMLPLANSFNMGSLVGAGQDFTLDQDNYGTHGGIQSRAAYLWQEAGLYAGLLYLNHLSTVDSWQSGESHIHIEDRGGGGLNKLYVLRSNNEAVTANDVWYADYYVRFKRFANGADGALARAA